MSFHATYNPHLLAPPTQRHPHHHNHHQNRLTQNAQASESTTSLNTGLRAKLRSALEIQKHANFDVKINIHEISNVPQLQGEFSCVWHFRGKSPKVRDGVSHKPSLPNLKFTQARHQESTASLPVQSVSDDKAKLPSGSGSTSQAMKGKSFSTPPFSLSAHSLLPSGKHKSVDKKGSDPTPLRNSLLGSDLQPVESPVSAENEDTPTASSSMVGRDSASSSLYNQTSTAASSTSYLSVPVPTRQSTDEQRPAEALVPIPIERSSSRQTMPMSKSKSTNISTHRNGITPNKPLDKNHTCTWDQEINVSLRIPISKSDGTIGKKPILGEGPKSHSGLKLEIQQLPTPAHPKHNEDAPHPHPPTHAHAQGEKDEEESGKHEKTGQHTHHPKGKPTAFGRVHIDLAAFAGRGRTTRKFLLKGSRTNATVQITVEMSFVGGDRDWVAPPLVEGHHVAARMKDIVGGRDTSENTQKDLQLTKTPSQSSTGSSISQGNSSLSRNPSSTIQGPSSRSYPQYKSYHHHLISAQDAKLRTPTASTSIPRNTTGQDTTTPNDRRAGTPGLGHEDETEVSASPSTPTRNFWNHRSRHTHGHLWKRSTEGIGPRKTPGIKEIDSMKIIEAIFNPVPGRVEGPFTYVPDVPVEQEEEELRGEAEHHESLPYNGEVVVGKRMGWRRKKTERKDTVSSVMTMGSRTVSGVGSSSSATVVPSIRNTSPVRGGRGVSPGRMPRVGSSHAIHS